MIKGTKYILLSNKENLGRKAKGRLRDLLKVNKALSTLYILKDDLRHLWDYTYEGAAKRWFKGWYRRAIRSGIKALKKFAKTLKRHLDGILAHCRHKLNTSVVEGMNNKAKVIKRVAYGYHDIDYYFLKLRGMIDGT